MLSEGNHKVTIIGSFTGQSQEKKTPYIGLELETENGEFIDWVAYLTENTAKRNIKTLMDAGFIGKKLADLSDPSKSINDLFNHNPKLTAVVEYESYTNDKGEQKNKPVVKWLNTGSFGPEKADHKQAVAIFSGTTFDGMMKEMQKTIKTKPETKKIESKVAEDDDLPF